MNAVAKVLNDHIKEQTKQTKFMRSLTSVTQRRMFSCMWLKRGLKGGFDITGSGPSRVGSGCVGELWLQISAVTSQALLYIVMHTYWIQWCPREHQKLKNAKYLTWNFNTRLLRTFNDKRVELSELFQRIPEHAEDLCAWLKVWISVTFPLLSFTGIFSITDVFFGILQSKTADMQFSLDRGADFYQCWKAGRWIQWDLWRGCTGGESADALQRAARVLLDNIFAQVRNRFKDKKKSDVGCISKWTSSILKNSSIHFMMGLWEWGPSSRGGV